MKKSINQSVTKSIGPRSAFMDGKGRTTATAVSDRHDKPFCTTAITIIDNFKKALGDADNR